MKQIPLTKGEFATVDDADFERLSEFKWYLSRNGYAVTKPGKKTIYMHRMVANAPDGVDVDHINSNRLFNTRKNLRHCSRSQNMGNRGKQINNSTGYKGVFRSKVTEKFRAQIRVKSKSIHLGLFDTPELAAQAYNDAAIKHFGKFAHINHL